jgi:hypothetical protein
MPKAEKGGWEKILKNENAEKLKCGNLKITVSTAVEMRGLNFSFSAFQNFSFSVISCHRSRILRISRLKSPVLFCTATCQFHSGPRGLKPHFFIRAIRVIRGRNSLSYFALFVLFAVDNSPFCSRILRISRLKSPVSF